MGCNDLENLVNDYRASQGVPRAECDVYLRSYSEYHSADQYETATKYDVSGTGSDCGGHGWYTDTYKGQCGRINFLVLTSNRISFENTGVLSLGTCEDKCIFKKNQGGGTWPYEYLGFAEVTHPALSYGANPGTTNNQAVEGKYFPKCFPSYLFLSSFLAVFLQVRNTLLCPHPNLCIF